MNVVTLFAFGTLISLCVTAGLVLLLRGRLSVMLTEVCGSPARAGYWTVVALVTMSLLGVLAGTMTSTYPVEGASATDLFFGFTGQVRFGLLGLLVSLLGVAVVLMRTIALFERSVSRAPGGSGPGALAVTSPPPAGGLTCPSCLGQVQAGAIWCPHCGSAAPDRPAQ